jgi:hypothetical protein
MDIQERATGCKFSWVKKPSMKKEVVGFLVVVAGCFLTLGLIFLVKVSTGHQHFIVSDIFIAPFKLAASIFFHG